MSANDADPTREMGNIPVTPQPTNPAEDFDAPIENNGVQLDSYAKTNSTSTNELNFSAEDIAKRQQADYFVKVEGAERRQRKAEKAERQRNRKLFNKLRHENPEKHKDTKLQNANTSEERKIIQQQKAQTRAEGRRIGFIKFKKFFFGGKRKIITFTILALAIIVPTGLSLYFNVYLPERERREDAAYEEYKKNTEHTVASILQEAYMSEMENNGNSDFALKIIDAEISKFGNDSPEYFMLAMEHGLLVGRKNKQEGIQFVEERKGKAKHDYQKEKYYYTLFKIYCNSEDYDNANKIVEEFNKLKRRMYYYDLNAVGAVDDL